MNPTPQVNLENESLTCADRPEEESAASSVDNNDERQKPDSQPTKEESPACVNNGPTACASCIRMEVPLTNIKEYGRMDVLCGRDKLSHSHCGNRRFRHIIEMYRQPYQTAPTREQKTKLTQEIVGMIRDCGGRFLKRDDDDGLWEDVGDVYAHEKVSHALRSARDPNRPRVKKPRVVVRHVPTPQEDELFKATYEDQQQLYQKMLRRESESDTNIDLDDFSSLENLL